MPKALGLIETRGLVAAIEAADAMVKAANVKIVGKEQTSPALITIKIVGDVAAVKSAVEAGAAAAQRVGELVSTHVIPQPDIQMLSLFPELGDDDLQVKQLEDISSTTSIEKPSIEQPKAVKPVKSTLPIPVAPKEKTSKIQPPMGISDLEIKSETQSFGNLFTAQNDTISRLRQEALGKVETQKKKIAPPENAKKDTVLGQKERINISSSEDIESLNVHQLRRLARDTENFPIKGREISKANRQELLEFFRTNS
jgi:ethanolamine utilization protein EutM